MELCTEWCDLNNQFPSYKRHGVGKGMAEKALKGKGTDRNGTLGHDITAVVAALHRRAGSDEAQGGPPRGA